MLATIFFTKGTTSCVGKYTFADCFNLEDEDPDYEEDVARYCAGIYRSVDGGSSWVLLDGVSGTKLKI